MNTGNKVWVVCSADGAGVAINGTITCVDEEDIECGEFSYVIDDVLSVYEDSFIHKTREEAEYYLIGDLAYHCNLYGLGYASSFLPEPDESDFSLEEFYRRFEELSRGKNVSVRPSVQQQDVLAFFKKERGQEWFNAHDLKAADQTVLEFLDGKNDIDTASRMVPVSLTLHYPRWVELTRKAALAGCESVEEWIKGQL